MNDTPDTDDGPRTAQLAEQIVNAIQHPYERVHHIRAALEHVPDDHPAADEITSTLELALDGAKRDSANVEEDLRAAYGSIPVGPGLGGEADLKSSVPAHVDVDLPADVWATACDRAEQAGHGVHEYLLDYLALQYRFTVDGEEVHRTEGYDPDA